MAKGKKTGGANFKPGESGNPNGRPPLPPEIRKMRAMTTKEVVELSTLMLDSNLEQLRKICEDPASPSIRVWMATIVGRAIRTGDYAPLEFLLNRTIGRVKEEIPIEDPSAKNVFNLNTIVFADPEMMKKSMELASAISAKVYNMEDIKHEQNPTPHNPQGQHGGSPTPNAERAENGGNASQA